MENSTRIAVGSILTECNQFGGSPIDLTWFERYDLYRGEDLLQVNTGVVGGALDVLKEAPATVVPLLVASTCPGGYLTADCYTELKAEILRRLQRALPVDGVLLLLHGAAVAEQAPDLEGDLISSVRELVGPDLPIVATLDLHAHVTAAMVHHADALLAWETYPHSDAYTTGQRGARLLLDTTAGRHHPTMAMAKVPVITSALHGSTNGDGPFARLMRHTKSLEQHPGVLSTSLLMVHPNLDQPDMGSGALVITDDDPELATSLATDVAQRYWQCRFELEPEIIPPQEAVARGLAVEGGPVVLVETADCAGGGAAGDSVATLKALVACRDPGYSLVPVVDPAAAAACQRAGEGGQVCVSLGHHQDPRWGDPMEISGLVEHLSQGRFTYTGGIWDGVEGDMGVSAVLAVGDIRVLITSHATYDWADEQYRAVDLHPREAKFVVAKNPMNYHNVYDDVARAVFILDTPGPTPPTLRHMDFRLLERPYFPVDEEIPGLIPLVLR